MAVRISITADAAMSVDLALTTPSGSQVRGAASADISVTIDLQAGPDVQASRLVARRRAARESLDRVRDAVGDSFVVSEFEEAAIRSVSPAMEEEAIRAFLASADTKRLGRSLAAVYRAMDAVRRGQDLGEDKDVEP